MVMPYVWADDAASDGYIAPSGGFNEFFNTNYYQWKLSIIYKIIILILHSMNCGMLIFPFHHDGQQEAGLRAGTENMAGIVGTACQIRFPVSLTQLCSISE